MAYEDIYRLITEERELQDEKWGRQDHESLFWLAILGEEYGELCRGLCETGGIGYLDDTMTRELVQIAAVCIAIIDCGLRNSTLLLPESMKEG